MEINKLDEKEIIKRYSLIPRTLIFPIDRERVLLIRGASHKSWAGLYNGIGGHIEPGEDILTAARRELREETGLSVAKLWLCGTITINTGQETGICLFVFRGEETQGNPIESKEGVAEWIPIMEVYTYPLVEDLPALLPRVLGAKTYTPAFSGHYTFNKDRTLEITFGD